MNKLGEEKSSGGGEKNNKKKIDWMKYNGDDDLREKYSFAQWPIERGEVFLWNSLSIAFTNLKPVLPGHVLVSPKRVVARFQDLTREEVSDLFHTARLVAQLLVTKYKADSYNITLQDGKASGQTVAHVHLHIMPRFPHDFDKLRKDNEAKKVGQGEKKEEKDKKENEEKQRPGVDREEQKPRTRQDMIDEALELREWMKTLAAKQEEEEEKEEGKN
ncbi:diadenosine tetraphosphatase family protein [Cystoisospora suis]|uniref:Diadenosine tetraphosphatase family protein n=1 Tax=Cystoisospora suis TaxID=483139 RepID=A0A2C6KUF2_9APIC|nr:diadenosine tetraphosphatase family protein [Cystoisospora suis]